MKKCSAREFLSKFKSLILMTGEMNASVAECVCECECGCLLNSLESWLAASVNRIVAAATAASSGSGSRSSSSNNWQQKAGSKSQQKKTEAAADFMTSPGLAC